jgi:hypothetical protein
MPTFRTSRRMYAAVLITVAVWAVPALADAAFAKQATAAGGVTTGSLHAPTNPTVSRSGCTATVRWTATVDAKASGYTLTAAVGSQKSTKSVTPASATSTTFTMQSGQNYKFSLATNYLNWTSSASSSTNTISC